jgi:hypothetical protein
MRKGNLIGAVLGVVVSFAVIYGYAYVIGKGWKKSQE